MDFLYAGKRIPQLDATIDLSDHVSELYEQAKKKQTALEEPVLVATSEKLPLAKKEEVPKG